MLHRTPAPRRCEETGGERSAGPRTLPKATETGRFRVPGGTAAPPSATLARLLALCGVALAVASPRPALARSLLADDSTRASVVKIYVTFQRENYTMPWQSAPPASGTGTGFVIAKRRILTNAHVVSDARFLEVQKDADPVRYTARRLFVAHDCDLAILAVDDPSFFDGTRPLGFASALPNLDDRVTVLGYPLGGTRLSVTQGVVSRIDYGLYSHSGVDQHLVLQVDAAINPGNSGGPVLFDGRVIGLAFQGLIMAENIGYAIPLPVLMHFLKDIDDGVYNGYPELGVATLDARNPALRAALKLPPDNNGVVVTFVDPFGSGTEHLRSNDVLQAIDDHPIANDGTIRLDGTTVRFEEILERKQWGEPIAFQVWRAGAPVAVRFPLSNPPDPFVFRNQYDRKPTYFVTAGLVFSPLTLDYLKAATRASGGGGSRQYLTYYAQYAKLDGLYKDFDEFVVLIRRLAHPVNAYAEEFVNGIVREVNGIPIRKLEDVRNALGRSRNGYHEIRFVGTEETLVLDAEAVKKADPEILRRYRIADAFRFED